jgi:Flp pilus assembly protein TadD
MRRARGCRQPGSLVATLGSVALGAAALLLSAQESRVAAQPAPVTFNKDIAPIVFSRCVSCHHPGGVGPFSLLDYASARPYATQIAAVTASRYMPPWKADAGDGPFVGQHPLTGPEIATFQAWVRDGALEGAARDRPPVPPVATGWQLGQPDLIVTVDQAYTLPAAGTDVFRIFVITLPVRAVRYVNGLEFRPGNPKVVHHANIRIDQTAGSRRYDDADPLPGYEGLISHTASYPDGYFLGWTPGQVSPRLPRGLAWRLNPGTDLVVEIHMQPSGKPELVQPSIGLFFGADPQLRPPSMLRLGRQSIDIPPGERVYTTEDSFVLPVDVEVQAIQPHAHYRARSVEGTATLPDGSRRQLIRIGDWDFRWQHVFRFVEPVALPKGTRLSMQFVYDNSAANPRNPVIPPRRVYWGQRSSDEMGDLWIQMSTKSTADLDVLNRQIAPKVMAEDVIGYERVIQSEPDSVALHDDAAVLYLKLGRPNEAVAHFARSAALTPASAAAHFNLGTALGVSGRFDDAIGQFREALRLRPDYAQAHNNLSGMLMQRGEIAEAVRHVAEALRLDPSNREAQNNAAQAVRLAERAADENNRKSPADLDVLAAAYAAAGQPQKAAEARAAAKALRR